MGIRAGAAWRLESEELGGGVPKTGTLTGGVSDQSSGPPQKIPKDLPKVMEFRRISSMYHVFFFFLNACPVFFFFKCMSRYA